MEMQRPKNKEGTPEGDDQVIKTMLLWYSYQQIAQWNRLKSRERREEVGP